MRRLTVLALVLLVGSFALVAAGCGSDDESGDATAADEWATDFCTAVTDWADRLQQIGNDITDPSSLNADSLREAADDVNAASDEFVEDVRALGAPDTESGQAVRDSLESLADTVEAERDDIEEAADDVSGITDIPAAISAIGSSINAMGSAFQTSLEAIEDADTGAELETALEQSEACDEITG